MLDLRDEQHFAAELAKCQTSQEIQNLTRARLAQFGVAQADETGRWSAAPGFDEKVEVSGETIGDENFLLEGNRLLTLRGTFRQRENMKREILQSGKRLVPYEG
jgi:hypothetical protein